MGDYIASVISSVKVHISGSDIDQELLIKLEQKWIEKLKIIDEEAEKAAASEEMKVDREAAGSQEDVTKDGLIIPQLDGHAESSDEDGSDGNDDDLKSDSDSGSDLDTDEEEALDGDIGIEMEPPGSADDVSDEEAADLFDTENVVVCQYEKISRSRNKWKFVLKDGVMNLNGMDFVFKKALGEA